MQFVIARLTYISTIYAELQLKRGRIHYHILYILMLSYVTVFHHETFHIVSMAAIVSFHLTNLRFMTMQ